MIMDVGEISTMLAGRIDELVADILPAARREGPEWRVGSVYGDAGRSMAINRTGSRAGVWCDFSADDLRGDALDLVMHVVCGGDKKKAVAWAKSWLGIDQMDPGRMEVQCKQAVQAARQKEKDAAEEVERRRKFAKRIWLEALPLAAGDPVNLYMLGRGISMEMLAKMPGALRFAASCVCYDNNRKHTGPAMLAAVVNSDGRHVATHRTFLKQAQPNVWGKASPPLQDSKKVLGSYAGGFIPLTRGASGKSFKDAPEGDDIMICEGIEDGLTLALCFPESRVLAAIAVNNFKNIRLPEAAERVTLCIDNDKPDSPAARAVAAAVDAFQYQGKQVFIFRPQKGKDFNDWLQSGASVGEVRA
jgi:hypothetical protein